MKVWKFRENSICPLCNETEENIHILRCKSEDATDRWTASISTLEQKFIDKHTPPNTVDMIVNLLHMWRDNTDNIPSCTLVSLSHAILAQKLIGQQAFMEGYLSVEWKAHASTFSTNKKSPQRWTALLVKKLWLVAFDMWDHICNILHKNDLSNKVKDLENINRSIRSLLSIRTIELMPHERRLFHITEASILAQTPKFRREWQVKANIIYQTHIKKIANTLSHRKEQCLFQMLFMMDHR